MAHTTDMLGAEKRASGVVLLGRSQSLTSSTLSKDFESGTSQLDFSCLLSDGKFNQRARRRGSQRARRRLFIAVLVAAIVVMLVCLCVYLSVWVETLEAVNGLEDRIRGLEAELDRERAGLQGDRQTSSRDFHAEIPDRQLYRRSKRGAHNRRRRGRRRNNRQRSHLPFVHLDGTTNSDGTPHMDADGTFHWNHRSEPSTIVGLGLEPSGSLPSTVRVNETGIYQVYSQMAVNGKTDASSHHVDCGHVTVLTRAGVDTVLLESRTTQYLLGRPYANPVTGARRAFDTALQMGTFQLHRGDGLRVRRRGICSHTFFRSGPGYTYFGVLQLHRYN